MSMRDGFILNPRYDREIHETRLNEDTCETNMPFDAFVKHQLRYCSPARFSSYSSRKLVSQVRV